MPCPRHILYLLIPCYPLLSQSIPAGLWHTDGTWRGESVHHVFTEPPRPDFKNRPQKFWKKFRGRFLDGRRPSSARRNFRGGYGAPKKMPGEREGLAYTHDLIVPFYGRPRLGKTNVGPSLTGIPRCPLSGAKRTYFRVWLNVR